MMNANTPEDMIHPGVDHDYDLTEIASSVHKVLMTLTPREERILRMRFGIGVDEHTLEDISKDFNTTRERIRQIEAKALRKLRHPSRVRELNAFRTHIMAEVRKKVSRRKHESAEYEKRYTEYLNGKITLNALLDKPDEPKKDIQPSKGLPWADSISIFKPPVKDKVLVKHYHPSVCAQCSCTPTYYHRLSWNAWKISNSWWEFCTYDCRAKTFARLNLVH